MPVYGLVECHHFVDCILSVNACCIHCFFEQLIRLPNIFKSAGVDMASVYLNLQKHVYRLLYSVAAVYDSINTSKISFEHLLCAGHN